MIDYNNHTRKQLIVICKEKGIIGYSRKNKNEIIQLIQVNNKSDDVVSSVVSSVISNVISSVVSSVVISSVVISSVVISDADTNKNLITASKWIPWSEKSADVIFEATKNGIGDGENKVASELSTEILGQNSPFDIEFIHNGILQKFDVKKLDSQSDFNTGKDGRNVLRPLKYLHTNLLISITKLASCTQFTTDEQLILSKLQDISPDELSVGTLRK
jgi:hypothetical protein